MKTPLLVKNRLRNKSCLKPAKSNNCCCVDIIDEIRSTQNEILTILRENVPHKALIDSNVTQCDLIDFTKKISDDQDSSSIGLQRNDDLPEPQFEVTYNTECSPSQIENKIEESFAVDDSNHLTSCRKENVITLTNEPKAEAIICEFDPLFVNHESRKLEDHANEDTLDEIQSKPTESRLPVSGNKRKIDLISFSDGEKSPETEHLHSINSNQSKRQKKASDPSHKSTELTVSDRDDDHLEVSSQNHDRIPTTLIEEIADSDNFDLKATDFVEKLSQYNKIKSYTNNWREQAVYNINTNERVDVDEVEDTIRRNWRMGKNNKRPFVCEIDHKCFKYFMGRCAVVAHIFASLFVIQCPNCELKFNRPAYFYKHLKICSTKIQSKDSVSRNEQSQGNFDVNKKLDGTTSLPDYDSDETEYEDSDSLPIVEAKKSPIDLNIDTNNVLKTFGTTPNNLIEVNESVDVCNEESIVSDEDDCSITSSDEETLKRIMELKNYRKIFSRSKVHKKRGKKTKGFELNSAPRDKSGKSANDKKIDRRGCFINTTEKEEKLYQPLVERISHLENLLAQVTNERSTDLSLEKLLKKSSEDAKWFYLNYSKDGKILDAHLTVSTFRKQMVKEPGSKKGYFRCSCEYCVKQNVETLGRTNSLSEHMLRQQGIKLQCHYCLKCFTSHSPLYDHLKKDHWNLGRIP